MLGQFMSSVVDALLSIPPIRFVMGLVDARWRPFWAALWLAAIAYVASRALNELTLRRARRRLLRDPRHPDAHATLPADREVVAAPVPASPPAEPTPSRLPVTAETPGTHRMLVPLPVVIGAVAVGAFVVAVVAVALRPAPNDPAPEREPAVPDTTVATAPGGLDVRWRSGRMSDDDCVGTFEVTRGSGTRARFVAFVMDSSGAIMARDSARVESAVSGLLVEFRFRHVDCDEIADWQLQALTPKSTTK